MNPRQLADLEAERTFLLRSLGDLDAEHAVGDVDEHDYATLRDGYTARAAAVLRQLEAGRTAAKPRLRRRWDRIALSVGIVVVVGVGGGWWVGHSSGQRLPGDQVSGGVADPESVTALLAQARSRFTQSDALGAIQTYQRVLDKDPRNAEALTYSGWLLYLTSTSASDDVRSQAVDAARQQLNSAIAADATYADPHCFLAVIAANNDEDAVTANDEGEQCLALDPPADARSIVEQFLAEVRTSSTPSATAA